jgi:endoglucanase
VRRVGSVTRVVVAGALAVAGGACGGPRDVEYAPLQRPFRGASLFPDDDSLAAHWQRAHGARWLDPISTTPQARWLTDPESLADLPGVVRAADRRGALPVLVAYYVPNRDCAGEGAADAAAYDRWLGRLLDALGRAHAAVIVEPDAVAADCFDDARARLLAGTVRRLAAAGHYVYLDAGHPRWRSAEEMADRLRAAGIADAEGFSLNVSNRQSTADSHRYGLDLSRRVGDREFVIDTSRDGLPAPPDDQWCNPARQGLGERPTADPGLDRVAALLWVKRPGESDGACGTERGHGFSPRQAQTLIVNASWVSERTRREAVAATVPGAG